MSNKKLISEDILPLSKRNGASSAELLDCLEQFEASVREMVEDPTFDTFDAINQQIRSINESIRDGGLSINSEDKAFDRVLKYMVDMEKISKGLSYLLEHCSKGIFSEDKEVDVTRMGIRK